MGVIQAMKADVSSINHSFPPEQFIKLFMTFDNIVSIPSIQSGSLELRRHQGPVVTLKFQQCINYTGECKPEKILYQSTFSVTPDGTVNTAPLSTIPLANPLKAVECSEDYVMHIFSDDKKSWLDIWTINPCAFLRRIEMKDQKILLNDPFGSRGWNNKGDKFVITSHSTKKLDEFEYKEDWGEQLGGVSDTLINIVDPLLERVEVFSAPEGYSAGQALHGPKHNAVFYIGYVTKPRRYGLIYCGNRPSALFKYDLETKQSTMLTKDCDSIRSPLLNAEETAIAYLTNSTFVAHRKCSAVILFNLETTNSKTIIEISDTNFVQALSIPKQSFIDGILFLDTFYGPSMRVLQVNVNTRQTAIIDTLLEDASSSFVGIANDVILLAETRSDQPWHLVFSIQ